jgi:hypothetical protein
MKGQVFFFWSMVLGTPIIYLRFNPLISLLLSAIQVGYCVLLYLSARGVRTADAIPKYAKYFVLCGVIVFIITLFNL